ncbi:MAG: BamA/TamA family outer membrane protein [Gemmatimonadaceae bacterium]
MTPLTPSVRCARRSLLPVLAALLLAPAPPALEAQYFGRNKVQYEDFDWQVLETEHFDIHFYASERVATEDAARMAERWYARLSAEIRHEFASKPLVLYADHPDFQQTNVIGGLISQGTGGVTEGLKTRVVMPFTGIYATFDHVLGHELVHAFQYDIAGKPEAGGLAALGRLPLWAIEGMAEYLSVGRVDPHTAMWLRDAAVREDLPTIEQLTKDSRYFPYRYGQALWAYVGGRWGDAAVPLVFRMSLRYGFEDAIRRVLDTSGDSLSADWKESILETYQPLIAGRTTVEALGAPILGDVDEPGQMNISPIISPDGRYVAFYSSRGLFSVNLYVADAATGEVIEELATPQTDAHFDALSFIYSAGTWSPDGRQFAFTVFADGDNQLAILDVDSRDVDRRISVRGVGAITDPVWSPDGRRIAFSGTSGGLSDLYVLDLETDAVRQLTADKYADLQPNWSPDGRTLVFSTDRGPGTDFDRLTFAELRLATLDTESGAIRVLPSFEGAKHINPVHSPDGDDIYFISDRGGFSDIYRLSLASGEVFRVTELATGVSGITAVSPALSVANNTGRLMFSVFTNGGYAVYALEESEAQGAPLSQLPVSVAAGGILPPVDALDESFVASYLNDPLTGLPGERREFTVSDYDPSFRLDYIGGQAVAGAGTQFGAAVGGGVSAFFSDMLGNQVIGATLITGGGFKDIGGQVVYHNLGQRWNWGAGAAHIPYLTGRAFYGPDPDNPGLFRYEQQLFRIFVDQVSLLSQYPLSTTRRFEANIGFTHLSYDFESQALLVNQFGQVVAEERQDLNAPPAIDYGEASGAFVGDNSFFGFTSPVAGGRYRFELSQTVGSLNFQTALADYRKYFFFRPITLAFRGMHYGRYGSDANSEQLRPLYLGYETLLRGYAIESFEASECTDTGSSNECPEFDRLIGDRIAIAGAELRIPLLGPDILALIDFPYLPLEVSPFFDAGVAWAENETVDFRFDRNTADRVPVFSTGVSARANLLGYIILEAYYAYPFQRPERGWHFGFNLSPGW